MQYSIRSAFCSSLALGITGMLGCSATAGPSTEDVDETQEDVVYGADHRKDFLDATVERQIWSESAAIIITDGSLFCAAGFCGVLTQSLNLCEGQSFVDQVVPTTPVCTAFLVAPDTMVTAGHCFLKPGDTLAQANALCQQISVVFDWTADSSGLSQLAFPDDGVRRCASVETAKATASQNFAVFKLSAPITDRNPLPVRRGKRKLSNTEDLVMIGHPSSLPLKIEAGGARVKNNAAATTFQANLDAFQGSSGSPVLNRTTGTVEGILQNGNKDYDTDSITGCRRVHECVDATGCTGALQPFELVARTSLLADFIPAIAPRGFAAVPMSVPENGTPLVGDFDGDGGDDVFFYQPGSAVDRVWLSTGKRTFDKFDNAVVGSFTKPLTGDFNGDGRWDIFWYAAGAAATDVIWLGSPKGELFVQGPLDANQVNGTYNPISGDFDGDGRWDIFWYAPGETADSVWYGKADGTFDKTTASPQINGTYQPFTGDFDGNGTYDIFFYSPGTAADVIRWNASDRTSQHIATQPVDGTFKPLAGDFDGDGRFDIFWYGTGGNADALWWGKKNKDFDRVSTSQGGTFNAPVAGDFDGDSAYDILWIGSGTAADASSFGMLK